MSVVGRVLFQKNRVGIAGMEGEEEEHVRNG